MSDFPMQEVDQPAIRCAGLKVRTTMAKAGQDCYDLWDNLFGPRMNEDGFVHDPNHPDESYGVSIMIDEEAFDYWALDSLSAGATVPAGMEEYTIPGGKYAKFAVSSIKAMGECYQYVYAEWLSENRDLELDMQRPCYELYGKAYLENGSLFILFPIKEV